VARASDLLVQRSPVRFPAVLFPGSLGQLSLPSFQVGKSSTSLLAGVKLRRATFTCIGWQVTLCDPIWQVTSRSSRTGISRSVAVMITN